MSKNVQEGMNKIHEGVKQIKEDLPAQASNTEQTQNSFSISTQSSTSHSYGNTVHNGVVTNSYDNTTITPTKTTINGVEASGEVEAPTESTE